MTFGGIVLAGVLSTSAVVLGVPSTQPAMTIDNAAPQGCNGGAETYRIDATITVENTTDEDEVATIDDVSFDALWTPEDGGGRNDGSAAIVDDGGMLGASIPARESETFNVVVDATIGCDAESGTLRLFYTIENRNKTYSISSDFLSSGTSVPVSTVGILVLAGISGVGLFVVQRRSGRARRAAGSSATP